MPTNRSGLISQVLREYHGQRGRADSRPVRTADFYIREFNADAGTDALTCRECKQTVAFDHDELPPVGTLLDCPNPSCGLPSRVPVDE